FMACAIRLTPSQPSAVNSDRMNVWPSWLRRYFCTDVVTLLALSMAPGQMVPTRAFGLASFHVPGLLHRVATSNTVDFGSCCLMVLLARASKLVSAVEIMMASPFGLLNRLTSAVMFVAVTGAVWVLTTETHGMFLSSVGVNPAMVGVLSSSSDRVLMCSRFIPLQ